MQIPVTGANDHPMSGADRPHRRFRLIVFGMAALVTIATAAGIGVRATYGAQTTADEPQYLLTAISLWEDGDLDISDELAAERYREFHEVGLPTQTEPLAGDRRVSPHDPLLPALLAVPIGLGGWMAAKAALAVMAGVLSGLMVWVAHRRLGVRPSVAAAVVGVLSLAPPLGIYATQVYPELPAALAVTVAIAALTGPRSARSLGLAAATVVVLPWLAVKYVPVAAVLAVAAFLRASSRQRTALFAALGVAGVTYVVGHLWLYGGLTPYATGDHFVGGQITVMGTEVSAWGRSPRLAGLLVDRGFGIGAWQPAYLLLPLAAARALASRAPHWRLHVSLLATGWLVASFMALTMHGWWFPGRQLVVVLPVAALLLAQWAETGVRRFWAVTGLGSLGAVAYAFLLIEGLAGRLTWVVDFGATANPLYGLYAWFLPDYMAPSLSMWIRHGLWAGALVALVITGWGSARTTEATVPAVQGGLFRQTERQAT